MKSTTTDDRELAVAMASSAGLELFWAVIAVGCALAAMMSTELLVLTAIAAIASSLAVLAHSGELAARWPRIAQRPGNEAIGFNLIAALAALSLGALAIVGVAPLILGPIALLLLAGLMVLDGPLEAELAAPRGTAAGGYMLLAGLVAIVLLAMGFSERAGARLVPWAALLIGSAQLIGAAALLIRFTRSRAA